VTITFICARLHQQPRCLKACPRALLPHHRAMDRQTATSDIRTICNELSAGITRIHPLLPALGDEPTKGEIIKALFELTKNVEVVKKQLMKLERRDDSALT
jgi:hypothetical protein